jgi:hypothetical protein
MYTGTTPLIYWYYKCTIYIYFGLTLDIELEAQWAEPMSLTFHSALRKLITDSSIGLSYQISVHLSTKFQWRRLEINQLETRITYGGHVC